MCLNSALVLFNPGVTKSEMVMENHQKCTPFRKAGNLSFWRQKFCTEEWIFTKINGLQLLKNLFGIFIRESDHFERLGAPSYMLLPYKRFASIEFSPLLSTWLSPLLPLYVPLEPHGFLIFCNVVYISRFQSVKL